MLHNRPLLYAFCTGLAVVLILGPLTHWIIGSFIGTVVGCFVGSYLEARILSDVKAMRAEHLDESLREHSASDSADKDTERNPELRAAAATGAIKFARMLKRRTDSERQAKMEQQALDDGDKVAGQLRSLANLQKTSSTSGKQSWSKVHLAITSANNLRSSNVLEHDASPSEASHAPQLLDDHPPDDPSCAQSDQVAGELRSGSGSFREFAARESGSPVNADLDETDEHGKITPSMSCDKWRR